MTDFAVHIKDNSGKRDRIIINALSPQHASSAALARIRNDGRAAVVLKVKALNQIPNTSLANNGHQRDVR